MNKTVENRLVFYTETPTTGGVTAVVQEIAAAAASSYDCTVICQNNPALRTWGEELKTNNIAVEYVALKNKADVLGWFEFRTLRAIYRSFCNADIVHIHLHTTFSCLPAIIIARLVADKPVITTEHYISQLRFIRNRRLIFPLALLREILIAGKITVKKISLRHINCVVTVSKANLEFLVSRFGRQVGDRATSIPNGVDIERFSSNAPPSPVTQQINPAIVSTIAGLNNQKGHEFLIHAIPLIRQYYPDVKFVFAGEGHLRKHLESLVATLGLSNVVTFSGHVEDVRPLLAKSTVIVLPSLFEGMPVSVLEAMAAGKAVVATNVDGTAEVVIDGFTGFLVPPKNSEQLAEKTVTLLQDRALREMFGRNAQRRIKNQFSLEETVENHLGLYARVLSNTATSLQAR